MGLGKTAQAIALDVARRIKQPNLVTNPKTLVVTYLGIIPSWANEFKAWAPHLRVQTINNKNRNPFIKQINNDSADVYICHWQSLRLIQEDIVKTKWFHLIFDECHALQNRKAKQTLAAKTLKGIYRTGLSGTPAYDKPDDLWSILNWLYPNYWSSFWRYYTDHIIYTDFDGYRTVVGVKNTTKLQKEMSGFYIRRRKEEVLLDLPEKYTTRREVDLTDKQARAYEMMRKDMVAWVGEHEDEPIAAPVVIAQLTRLQQFSDAFGKIEEIVKIKKITRFNNLTNQEETVSVKEVNHVMMLDEPSSKLDAVMEILLSTSEPVVIFSQFSQVIKLLGKRCEKAGISHGLFIGETSTIERAKIIEDFQAGHLKVFAGTISAGGIGITLTAASTVIFIDRSWSAANNRQAEDRLHRIGQKNAVQVIDIVSRGTIDSKRHEEIDLKWSWILKLLGEGDDDE